jgi:molybdopterin synthase catalytic subunit
VLCKHLTHRLIALLRFKVESAIFMFKISSKPILVESLRKGMISQECGGFVTFEGWVRDYNDGKAVLRLEYEAYAELAILEGQRVLGEARDQFPIKDVRVVHRVGLLQLKEVAVWVGAAAVHRHEAFEACRYVIDEIKRRVPIWKKEFFADGTSAWTRCERCAEGHRHRH